MIIYPPNVFIMGLKAGQIKSSNPVVEIKHFYLVYVNMPSMVQLLLHTDFHYAITLVLQWDKLRGILTILVNTIIDLYRDINCNK